VPRKATTAEPLYHVHPGVAMIQNWVATLKEKTGKSLAEWVKASGIPTEPEQREWLKAQHKFGTNTAWWIVERAHGKPPATRPRGCPGGASG
jgi:hypothetical protein